MRSLVLRASHRAFPAGLVLLSLVSVPVLLASSGCAAGNSSELGSGGASVATSTSTSGSSSPSSASSSAGGSTSSGKSSATGTGGGSVTSSTTGGVGGTMASSTAGGTTSTSTGAAGGSDGGDVDGGDAGAADGAVMDAGPPDAGGIDAGGMDASVIDGGPIDAGRIDAGPIDAGPIDAGPVDAGALDAGVPPGTVLILAGGPQSVFAGEFHGLSWATTSLADATNDGPALALTGPSSAIGVIRSTTNAGELRASTWSPGSFSAFAALAPLETTHATPFLAASGARADLVFQGDNFKHYYASHSMAGWAPLAEPIQAMNGPQIFGPSPASVASLGSDTVLAFAGNDGDVYDETRTAGAWGQAHAHGLGNVLSQTPIVVAMNGGPADLMVAFVRASDSKVMFTTRAGGVWSAMAAVEVNTYAGAPPALAPLPGGNAVLAFRGLDGKAYWSRYTSGANPPWAVPGPVATPNVGTPSTPALAAGIGGTDAELAFINTADGAVYHARLAGQVLQAPALVGGSNLKRVALASAP